MPKVTHLFAWVIADKDEDDEGVPAFAGPDKMIYPLIGADMERADSYEKMAQLIANRHGKPIKLVKSTGIEVVKTVRPQSPEEYNASNHVR